MTAFFLPVLPVRGTGPLVPTLSSVSGSVHWNGDPSSPHCQNSHSAAQNGPGVPGFLSGKGQRPPGDTPGLTRPDPVASNGVSYVSPLSSPGVGQMCFSPAGSLEHPLLAHSSLPFLGLAQGPLPCLFWVRSQPSCTGRSPAFFLFILALSTVCLLCIFLEHCSVGPERQARIDPGHREPVESACAAQGWLHSGFQKTPVFHVEEGPPRVALQPHQALRGISGSPQRTSGSFS